jgi:transcriptional regulator
MYRPPQFRVDDPEEIRAFLLANSFGTLVSHQAGPLVATHLPFTFEFAPMVRKLLFHLSRQNEQAKLENGAEVLAIFLGPHAYISNESYEEAGTVPTWNYESVHIYGRVERIEGTEELRQGLLRLLESRTSEETRVKREVAEGSHDKTANEIRMFTLAVDRIETAWKLSQHHSRERTAKVVAKLEGSPDAGARIIASEMRRHSLK